MRCAQNRRPKAYCSFARERRAQERRGVGEGGTGGREAWLLLRAGAYGGMKNLRKDMVKREISVFPVGMGNFLDWGGNIFINSLDKFIKIIYNRGAVRGWDISPGC